MIRIVEKLLCSLLLVGSFLSQGALALPDSFQDVGIARIQGAMDIEFLPSPGPGEPHPLLFVNKEGELWIIDDPDNVSRKRLIGDINSDDRLCTNGSRGFMSVVPHPDFLTNRWLYFYYVGKGADPLNPCAEYDFVNGPINHIARVKMLEDYTLDMSTEETLLYMTPGYDDLHVGGDMLFGVDGMLWVTTGETGYKPYAMEMHEMQGSLIRLTPEGGIPEDNPYQASTGYSNTARCNVGNQLQPGQICEEIWAIGLRSPYRFARDPNAVDDNGNEIDRIFFMDVGGNAFEEINEAGTNFKGVNYGSPIIEGPCDKSLAGNRLNCTEGVADGTIMPWHWYQRTFPGDAAAVGGAFIPNGLWPPEYDNTFLWSDYPKGAIFHIWKNESAECLECTASPIPPTTNTTFLVGEKINAMTFGPYLDTQALYYTSRDGQVDFTIRRITYEGGSNHPPTCILSTDIMGTHGNPNEPIRFDASLSSDFDGDALTYMWDFDDGDTSATQAIVNHTYTTKRIYNVLLTITDAQGGVCNLRRELFIGEPPSLTMDSPTEGTQFTVGEIFRLFATAYDSAGNPMDSSHLTWEMRRHHNTHFHPWLAPFVGNDFDSIEAPPPEDLPSSLTSYVEIIVTATDDDGLTATVSRDIWPKLVEVDLEVIPAGLPVELVMSDISLTAPIRVPMWDNEITTLTAGDIPGWVFVGWSDGGAQSHSITIPARGPTVPVYTATYESMFAPTASPWGAADTVVVARLTCGTDQDYVDTEGNIWLSDDAFTSDGLHQDYTAGTIANTDKQGLYQTWREEDASNPSDLSYSIPVPSPGEYTIRLYFMERKFGMPGRRVMDIYSDGSLLEDDLDIVVEAGGRRSALYLEYQVVATGTVVDLRLESGIGESLICGIAVASIAGAGGSSAPTPVPTLAPTPSPVTPTPPVAGSVHITCGTAVDYTDSEGTVWMADEPLTTNGVNKEYLGGDVANTLEQGLFQTYREEDAGSPSNIFYRIPVPQEGAHMLHLYFMEPDHDQAGEREMDIVVEGVKIVDNLDVWIHAGGKLRAFTFETPIDVEGGTMSLRLTSARGLNLLSGIAIIPIGGPSSTAAPVATPTVSPAATPTVSPVATPTVSPVATPTVSPVEAPSENVVLRITCGTDVNYVDSEGMVWMADASYTSNGLHQVYAGGDIANTAEQGLFATWREEDDANRSNIFYVIPVPEEGNYILRLYLMEPEHNEAGKREMDIYAEGIQIANDLDVWSEAGMLTAFVYEAPVTVVGGTMAVRFTSQRGLNALSAMALIEV